MAPVRKSQNKSHGERNPLTTSKRHQASRGLIVSSTVLYPAWSMTCNWQAPGSAWLAAPPLSTTVHSFQCQDSKILIVSTRCRLLRAPVRSRPPPLGNSAITNLANHHTTWSDHFAPQVSPHLIQLFASLLVVGPQSFVIVDD